jgi:hypothetical protein
MVRAGIALDQWIFGTLGTNQGKLGLTKELLLV